ncbi:ribosome hibernation-promoting factor, HPF/YfiA family [Mechercharimyces sp. CAU 1602]|uniref:ribosome hibernation-promoting factor, HPF/YfiA family n=1 Tax=Mechercharimyces sp. CAU 1602 TaxID=2973933 RepID=UPI0021625CB8|nr:ribosome-associated translation inhibitor RaiA [Mechercharimyces sp. CAU 1602]MCS1352229.1 ribosome-associated translation inhibitor RaiA [Mechercharimyces sp. CAU 1602]
MHFHIRGQNIEVTDALKQYTEKKIGRLEKYFETTPKTEVHAVLSVFGDDHKVEVTIPFPELLVRAEETTTDMYTSISKVEEKLERQIRKYKTKVNRKFRQDASLQPALNGNGSSLLVEEDELDDDDRFEVVRTKRFSFKPMDVEEAILQMNMLGHNFFVFANANSDQTSVVYKRHDGRYGLIEPE